MPGDLGRIGPRGPGAPGPSIVRVAQQPQYGQRVVAGVTQDNTGAILGGATVDLFRVGDNAWIARLTSDASTGAYSFPVADNDGTAYFVRCWHSSGPVFGSSDNTLTGLAP